MARGQYMWPIRGFFRALSAARRDSSRPLPHPHPVTPRLFAAALTLPLLVTVPGARAAPVRRLVIQVAGGRAVEVFRAVPVYRALSHQLAIGGPGVEKTVRVEGSRGLVVTESGIRRSPDALKIPFQVDASAPFGPGELRLNPSKEPAEVEVIPLVILRNGRVISVEPRKVAPGEKVTLTFSGTDVGNAEVLAQNAYIGARVLPGGSETRCQVELTFNRPGLFEVPLYDKAGLPKPGPSLDAPGGYARGTGTAVEVAAR